jgi:hypothetical protein
MVLSDSNITNEKKCIKLLVGKAKAKRPLRRPERKFEYHNEIYLTEPGYILFC